MNHEVQSLPSMTKQRNQGTTTFHAEHVRRVQIGSWPKAKGDEETSAYKDTDAEPGILMVSKESFYTPTQSATKDMSCGQKSLPGDGRRGWTSFFPTSCSKERAISGASSSSEYHRQRLGRGNQTLFTMPLATHLHVYARKLSQI